jgi:RNA recognition motif-containing protein
LIAPSDSAVTLFIGGLTKEIGDIELKNSLPKSIAIKRPVGKSFAFVDFETHEAAKKVIEASTRRGFVIKGRTLTVGWAKEKEKAENFPTQSAVNEEYKYERELVPPTSDAKILFVGGLPSCVSVMSSEALSSSENSNNIDSIKSSLIELFECHDITISRVVGKSYAFVEFDSYDTAMRIITKSINETLKLFGKPLTIGWAKASTLSANVKSTVLQPPSSDSKVLFVGGLTSEVNETNLKSVFNNFSITSIKRPEGKDFAFVEFSNSSQAQSAMSAVNGIDADEIILYNSKLSFGWAKGRPADQSNESSDCWFCLASPTVKVVLFIF